MSISSRTFLTRLLLTGVGLTLLPMLCLARVASAAPFTRPVRTASLATIVLTVHDVAGVYGSGFAKVRAGVVANQEAVQGSNVVGADGMQLLRDGRVTGYSAQYAKGRLTFVVNNIDQFKSSSGADRYFQYFKTFYSHHFLTGASTRAASIGSAALLRTTGANGHFSATLTFLFGRYVASTTLVISGTMPGTSGLVRLAKIEEGRIQSHG